jgi:hypothetical protein
VRHKKTLHDGPASEAAVELRAIGAERHALYQELRATADADRKRALLQQLESIDSRWSAAREALAKALKLH